MTSTNHWEYPQAAIFPSVRASAKGGPFEKAEDARQRKQTPGCPAVLANLHEKFDQYWHRVGDILAADSKSGNLTESSV